MGNPIRPYNIFGDIFCQNGADILNECDYCLIEARGLRFNFPLNHNDYSLTAVENWELYVFTRNVKSYNKAVENNYNT